MRKILTFLMAFCMSMLCFNMLSAQNAHDYRVSVSTGTYTPITGTFLTTTSTDDGNTTLTLPAPFHYCGSDRSSLFITPNGVLIFDATASTYINDLSSTTYRNVLAPFWDDLAALTANNSISWALDDTDPDNSILTIQYENVYRTNSNELLNFQVKLYYATGTIEFVYGSGFDAITAGTTASIGINNHSASASTTYFLSITPTGSGTMTYSTYTANNTIDTTVAAHIASGTTYTFELSACMSPNNIMVSDVFADGATITWDENNDALGWLVSYMETGGTWSDEEFITTNEYSWNEGDLNPNTSYIVKVAALCNATDTSYYANLTFSTSCAPVSIPFIEDFDEFSTGSSVATPCWTRLTNYFTQGYPYVSSTYFASPPNSLYFYGYNTTYEYAVTPPVDVDVNPINTLKVKFKVRTATANAAAIGIQVGVMTDPGDHTTFEPIGDYHRSSSIAAFEEKSVSLASYTGTGRFIALRSTGSGTMSYYNYNHVDDFEIVEVSDCEQPDFTVSNFTDHSADINILVGNIADQAWYVYYKLASATDWDSVYVTTNPFTLTSLQSSTSYQMYVKTDCGYEFSLPSTTRTFQTACAPIMTLPWNENFDFYGTGATAFASCWERYNNGVLSTVNPFINDNFSVSSPGAMYFSNSTSLTLVSPEFDEDINQLAVTFWLRREGVNSGTFSVGYLATVGDPTSFVAVDTFDIASTTWLPITVYNLASVPAGIKQFAFRQNQVYSNWYYWLDDVSVDYLPDCFVPTNLTASNVTNNSINLSWDDLGSSTPTSWIVRYTYNDLPYVYEEVYTNPCTISNLPQNSVLTFSVAGICNGTDTTGYSGTGSYGLACMPVSEFPWRESFESYWWMGTGLEPSTTVSIRWCWINVNGGNATYRWQGTTGTPYQGTGAMYSSASTTTPDMSDWMITPVISLSGNQFLRFHARGVNAIDTFSLRILDVSSTDMTAYSDTANFTLIGGVKPVTGSYNEYEFDLSSYSGDHRIAFHRHSVGGSVYIDEMLVNDYSSCVRVSDLFYENETPTSVDVGWTNGNPGDNAWWVFYKPVSGSDWDSVHVTTNPATLSSLDPSTIYDWYVKTDCGSLISEVSVSSIFMTECDIIVSFPWSEGFEIGWIPAEGVGNKAAPNCWTVVDKGGVSGSNNYWWTHSVSPNAYAGSGSAQCYTDYGISDHNDWLITPQMSLTGNERLRFWAMRANTSTGEPDEISIFISDEDIILDTVGMGTYGNMSGFQEIFQQNLPTGDWARYEVNLNQYTGNRYIAFVRQGTPDGYYLRLDDVLVEPLPNCTPPHSITVSNLTTTSVDVNFSPGQLTDNAWRIYYKASTATAWDSVDVFSSPAQLNSLMVNTTYQFYLRTDCGTELSEETDMYTFTTLCPAITTIPWGENFDTYGTGSTVFVDCWERYNNNILSTANPYINNNYSVSSPGAMYFSNSTSLTLVSPPFDEDINQFAVSFWLRREGASSGTFSVGYLATFGDPTSFVSVATLDIASSTWLQNTTYNLAGVPDGIKQFAFRQNQVYGSWYYWLDDVTVDYLPDCIPPMNLTANDITDNSMELSWDDFGSSMPTSWIVRYTQDNLTYVYEEVYTNPCTISNLPQSTALQISVAGICNGTDTTDYSVTINYDVPCALITSFPWSEGFETGWVPAAGIGNKAAPNCWIVVDKGGVSSSYNYWWTHNASTNAHTGSGSAQCYTDYGTSDHNDWLIMPQMSLTGNERLVFWAMRANVTTSEPDEISIFISDEDATLDTVSMGTYGDMPGFQEIFRQNLPTGNWARYEVNLNQYTGNRYIAFVRQGTPDGYYLRLDDVLVEPLPNCVPPQSITVSNFTATGADINFLPGRLTDNAWRLYYRVSGTTAWDSVDVFSSPVSLNLLTANTTYQFCLKTDCGTELSLPSSIQTFQTPCDLLTSLPIVDHFDNYGTGESVMPSCWTRTTTYTNRPYVISGSGVTGNCLYFYTGTAGTYNIAAIPAIDVSLIPINTLMASFQSRAFASAGSSDTLYVGVMTDPMDASTFEVVSKIFNTEQYVAHDVLFNNYAGTGQYIAFKIEYNANTSYAYIDDLVIDLIPACPGPQNFTATQDSPTSAYLSWDEVPATVSRTLEYKKSTDTTWIVDPNVTAPPYVVSLLDAENTYNFRLKLACGGTDESDYKYADTYVGYYCMPTFAGIATIYYTTSVVTAGASTTDLNDITSCTANTYYNRTSLPFEVAPGDSITFTATYMGGTHGIAIWVDLDQNYIFDASEKVYNTTEYLGSPHSGTVTIPATIPGGTYRVRMQIDGNSTNPSNPCQNNSGNIIDYAMVVGSAVAPCNPPTNVAVSNILAESATVTWTAGGTETNWIVEHRKGNDAYSSQTVNQRTANLANLAPNTLYDVRVKAVCDSGNESEYTATTFTTVQEVVHYTITPSVEGSGTITPATAVQVVEGLSQRFEFSPDTGQVISEVLIDGVGDTWNIGDNSYTFINVQANHTIKVVFVPLGIENYDLLNSVQIFPNPAENILNVKTEMLFETVEITNILGQVIYSSTVNDLNFSINVSSYNAGVYFIKLSGSEGNAVKKFVVKN